MGDLRGSQDDLLGDLLLKTKDAAGQNFGDIIRYDHVRTRWLVWNGVRWHTDTVREVYDLLRMTAERLIGAAADNDERKLVLPLFNTAKKEAVLKSLSARDGIRMTGNEWDLDGDLIGFNNGIANIAADTFDTHPDPGLLVSKSVGIDLDTNATCPTFEWFLNDIMGGDADLVAYLKRLIGYSLIGTQEEQKFWMWVGRGSNGKGVLARTLYDAFGDYADAPADTLYMRTKLGAAPSSAARPDLLRLQAVRFTYMSEPPGGQFNEEMLKAHTGDDAIMARDLYGKAREMATFRPTHKINFLTNDPPKTEDVGIAMSRRARVIKFRQNYAKNPDRGLEARLKLERAGIVRLAIAEAIAYRQYGLPEPALVEQWSKEYIQDNDPLSKFLEERCVEGYREVGSSAALWASYQDWCAVNQMTPDTNQTFGRAMGRKFDKGPRRDGVTYKGVRAKNAMEMAVGEKE